MEPQHPLIPFINHLKSQQPRLIHGSYWKDSEGCGCAIGTLYTFDTGKHMTIIGLEEFELAAKYRLDRQIWSGQQRLSMVINANDRVTEEQRLPVIIGMLEGYVRIDLQLEPSEPIPF